MEVRYQPERSLRWNVVAGILALVVAMGIGYFAYTPVQPAVQERFDLSNAANTHILRSFECALMLPILA